MLLDRTKASLLLIDMQERLLPAMEDQTAVESRVLTLLKTANILDVPVTVSEQYPRGLGHTVQPIRQELGSAPVFAKQAFSCWRDPGLKSHLIRFHEHGRPLVVVAGIEAHVCVLQSCIDLANAGFGVFAVADAMSSRKRASVDLAVPRLAHAGVEVVNTEMVLFELLGQAGTSEFKAISAFVR